ncbi:hypothetical protein [Polynucleobacter asymbioticus]|jgi:hypothetical protein|uniref:Uncharacterized protein n=1 Tax=Polynucleobacter asymbioticus TaxID=576611 RepID=A0AAC9IVC8_9BURK|nr:hypothetical protein [Polynucleobacter asymbioticus]APB99036.1 hypothetical protein A4F89_06690 [Polynucleobacter asymbioticus]APC01338.1 hypothetical protein AOC25_06790 [Polynucleobacter asymbioticus]
MKKNSDPGVINGLVNIPSKSSKSEAFKPSKQSDALPKGEINPFVANKGSSKGGANMGNKNTGKF